MQVPETETRIPGRQEVQRLRKRSFVFFLFYRLRMTCMCYILSLYCGGILRQGR